MSSQPYNASSDYQPENTIPRPVIFDWPPKPLLALKYLLFDMMFPWGYLFLLFSYVGWFHLSPSMATMANLEFGWIALLWLRNAGFLLLVAGGLHWWLYMRKSQGQQYKFHRRWMDKDNNDFLWGDQVWDNVFWSVVSGVTIWTGYEAITYWIYANEWLVTSSLISEPWYFIASIYGVFFIGTVHFYLIHRLSHWPPVYNISHVLHHRNVNTGPWSGISMHPIEHLLYFSVFVIVWFIPVHPMIVVLISMFFGVGPATSHCGFDFIQIKKMKFSTGDWFHQLHHQYFDLNYGNTPSPLDKVFGSWHDGSKASLQAQKLKSRNRRKASNANNSSGNSSGN